MKKLFLVLMILLFDCKVWSSPVSFQSCSLPDMKEQLSCTTVEVYENRTTKDRKIPIHVAILRATARKDISDPLFVLAGGPGQAASDLGDFVAEHFAAIRADHDLVYIDVRGTGESNRLPCNLYDSELRNYFGELFPVDRTKQCLEELEKRADLKFYTTTEIVRDLEEIRNVLGYSKVNLYGTSYGTRVALVYMRMYPEAIRSVILHGPAPTDLKAPLYHAWAGQQSLKNIFNKCETDQACHKAFPNIQKEFEKILQELDQSVSVDLMDPASKKQVTVRLTRGVFGEALRNMLYSPQLASKVPFLIHKASQGNFGAFAEFNVLIRKNYQEHLAIGLLHSVSCAEDVPFITKEDVDRETKNTFLQDYRIAQQQQACKIWPRGTLPAGFSGPVRSDIPTLIVTGEFDPVTPPKLGKQVAEYLSNSKNLIVKGGSHSGGDACMDTIMSGFIKNPQPKQIDDSCMSKQSNAMKFDLQ